MKSNKDSNVVAQTSVTHKDLEKTAATHRNAEQTAATHRDLEQTAATREEETGIFIIWNMF